MSAALLLLAACSWGQFKFRGLSRAMNCTEAVEQEQRLGSHFVRMEVDESTKTSQLRREFLTGTLEQMPVEIVLECIEINDHDGPTFSTLFDAAYMARISKKDEALRFHESVRAMLAKRYGAPVDREEHRLQDSPGAQVKGTSELTWRGSDFGCTNTTLGIGDHRLGLITQYPVADRAMFETTVEMRFQGGVC
jgi:hypothetical protein